MIPSDKKCRARVDARGWWRIGQVRIEPKAGENPADRKALAMRLEQFLNGETAPSAIAPNDLELKRVAYVLGMALLQSSVITDDETIAARDYAVSLGADRRVMFNRADGGTNG